MSTNKKIIGYLLLFFSLSVFADNSAKSVLNIQQWKTQNGVPVYFVQTPEVPMVQINVVFNAGTARDGDKYGLAQFTANMLNEGTTTLNADQIAQTFDSVGAMYNTTVNRDMTVVSLQSLTEPKYFNTALNTFINILTTPNFPADGFARTQKQTIAAIQAQMQDPGTVAMIAFLKDIYGDHPYAHTMLGDQQTITAMTPADLTSFYQNYYVAKNAYVTIVGAVDKKQAETIANQVVAKLALGHAADSIPKATLAAAKQQAIAYPSEQTHTLIGQVGINYQDPRYFPLMVGNYILGGGPLTSRLFLQVREKQGLAYTVSSGFAPLVGNGLFMVSLQTRNDQAEKALKMTQQVIADFVKQGPTAAEMKLAQQNIINGFPLTLSGNDAISAYLILIGYYHLPTDYLNTYREKVAAVTADQVKSAFSQLVNPNQFVIVTAGQPTTPPVKN